MGTRGMWVRLMVMLPMLAALLALGAPKGASAATVCGDTQIGLEEITGTIRDSIVVPADALCVLSGATVRGGVTVQEGGALYSEFSEIRGSVSGAGVDTLDIWGGVVRGSVTVSGATAYAIVESAEVRGNVVITGAGDATLNVGGSATLNTNGVVNVHSSTIAANLSCAGNSTVILEEYVPNTVGGVTNCPAP